MDFSLCPSVNQNAPTTFQGLKLWPYTECVHIPPESSRDEKTALPDFFFVSTDDINAGCPKNIFPYILNKNDYLK